MAGKKPASASPGASSAIHTRKSTLASVPCTDLPARARACCNRVNDNLIFIRACIPAAAPQLVVIFDHFLDTTAGVTGLEIIDETRRVRSVMNSLPPLDTDKVLS